jgi:hypothetical protein
VLLGGRVIDHKELEQAMLTLPGLTGLNSDSSRARGGTLAVAASVIGEDSETTPTASGRADPRSDAKPTIHEERCRLRFVS